MNTDFFNFPSVKDLPDDIVSETFHTIYGYKFRCVKEVVKMKRKQKIQEHWFCLKEGLGQSLPEYIREGAKRTGFKDFRKFFAMLGYYKLSLETSPIQPVFTGTGKGSEKNI